MDYKQWVELFGRTTEDKSVCDALAKAGIKKPPIVAKDETDVRIVLKEMMLIFTDEALFPDLGDVGEGSGVLTGVVLFLRRPKGSSCLYTGDLPFELNRDDSQETLCARFGDPVDEDEEFRWEEWNVGELVLNVTYAEDLGSLESISVTLPEPD